MFTTPLNTRERRIYLRAGFMTLFFFIVAAITAMLGYGFFPGPTEYQLAKTLCQITTVLTVVSFITWFVYVNKDYNNYPGGGF